jgi:DNA-binding HxlR family transcriptional regulator
VKTYGQYCPIARGSEIFAERWTPLVLRNLRLGCRTFSEIHAGVPTMSRSLLSARLRSLERRGVVASEPSPSGRGSRYELTHAGEELADLAFELGTWGARWLEVSPEHSDPVVVLWGWKNDLVRERLPSRRALVRFDLRERKRRRFWLLVERGEPEICLLHPGGEEDLIVTTDAETLMLVHMGSLTMAEAAAAGRWRAEGDPTIARRFPTWGGVSRFAKVKPAPARLRARAS